MKDNRIDSVGIENLESLNYQDLQDIAEDRNIRPNQKKKELCKQIRKVEGLHLNDTEYELYQTLVNRGVSKKEASRLSKNYDESKWEDILDTNDRDIIKKLKQKKRNLSKIAINMKDKVNNKPKSVTSSMCSNCRHRIKVYQIKNDGYFISSRDSITVFIRYKLDINQDPGYFVNTLADKDMYCPECDESLNIELN